MTRGAGSFVTPAPPRFEGFPRPATTPFPPRPNRDREVRMATLPPELDELSRRFDALRGAL